MPFFPVPSGTRKSFAGEVMARILELPVISIDPGSLVSKYIGEAEKNLKLLFNAA